MREEGGAFYPLGIRTEVGTERSGKVSSTVRMCGFVCGVGGETGVRGAVDDFPRGFPYSVVVGSDLRKFCKIMVALREICFDTTRQSFYFNSGT